MDQYTPQYTTDPVEMLGNAAEELVTYAAKLGYTITIEQAPKQPLAIGNSVSRIDVRMSHAHYRHVEKVQEGSAIVGGDTPKIILPH